MKLNELFDRGDHELQQSVANRQRELNQKDQATKGIWWVDGAGKKLAGPFADQEKADSFKKNRPDRVPKGAKAITIR